MEYDAAAAHEDSEPTATTADERRAHEREALRRRVRQSLLLCPDPQQFSPRA
jgi:hypothetical protein